MRCEVQSGFLMIRKCSRVAADKCCFCGIGVCSEHGYPLTREQISMYNVPTDIIQPISCQKCIQMKMQGGVTGQPQPDQTQQQQAMQQGQQPGYYYDPYPYYPYGGYHPYYWGNDFNDRDRQTFNQQNNTTGVTDQPDTLES